MKGSVISEQDYKYISEKFAADQVQLMKRMKRRADEEGLPEIMISGEQAKVLRLLVQIHQPSRCLDIGTLFGFSAAILARAMGEEGQVVTMERNEDHLNVAEENFRELGLEDQITTISGNAVEELEQLRDEPLFDLVMIDADKENYPSYYEHAVSLLREGGLILADNTLYRGKVAKDEFDGLPDDDSSITNVRALREFNDLAADHPDTESVIIPTGDGFNVSRYTG